MAWWKETWGVFLLALTATVEVSRAAIVPVSNCDGYTTPAGCTKGVNCAYEASWRVYEAAPVPSGNKAQVVVFTVTIRRAAEKAANFYTAIGFSEHQAMPDTDVAIGSVYNNKFLEVVDAYIEPGQIKPPTIDPRQDVFNYSGSLVDDPNDRAKGVLTFSFARRLDTGDTGKDISLTQCRYFFFVAGGGVVSGPRTYFKHDVTPDMSAEKICLTKCVSPAGGSAVSYSASWVFLTASIILAFLIRL